MQNTVLTVTDLDEAVALIDYVFRDSQNMDPTMQQEFPLLYSQENKKNMHAIYKDGKIVSVVSYLPSEILIEGASITAASVGGVCTHEDFEKQGLSSAILDVVEEKMASQGIDVMIVSGRRNLYLRRGCSIINCIEEYKFLPEDLKTNFTIRNYQPEDIYAISKLYNQNPTRYKRSLDQFSIFMEAVPFNKWCSDSRVRYVIEEDNKIIGYFILFVTEENKGFIQEASGSTEILSKAFKKLSYQLGIDSISIHIHQNDLLNQFYEFDDKKHINQSGTLKIIRYTAFMEHLREYFRQYLNDDEISKLHFYESDDSFAVNFGKENLRFKNISDVNQMVFEGVIVGVDGQFKKLLEKIFPIPFPYTSNLNFQ